MPPIAAFSRYPSARWASLIGSGLRHCSAGSPGHGAESSSSSYGPVSHLRLLPTPPHGGAVTFSFRPESVCLERTCTSLTSALAGARTAGVPPACPEKSTERRPLSPPLQKGRRDSDAPSKGLNEIIVLAEMRQEPAGYQRLRSTTPQPTLRWSLAYRCMCSHSSPPCS